MNEHRYITVVETKRFIADVSKDMTEKEREEFIRFIAQNPTKGAIIEGTGGIRKIRWAIGSRGKSSGVRVIYYYHNNDIPLFLLTAYRKKQKANVTQTEKNLMKKLVREIVATYTSGKQK